MGRVKDWAIELMQQEGTRADEELYRLHLDAIAKSRIEIELLKSAIKQNLSRFDFDSLQEIEAMVKTEKGFRPEELYFDV